MALLAELIEFEEFPGHELRVAVFANVGKSLPPQIADRQGADLVLCKGDAIASEMHLRLAAYTALVRAKSHKARHKSIHTELMMLFSSSRGLTKGLQEVGFAEPGRPLVVAAWGMELERFSEVAESIMTECCCASLPLAALDEDKDSEKVRHLSRLHKVTEAELALKGGLLTALLSRMASKDIM